MTNWPNQGRKFRGFDEKPRRVFATDALEVWAGSGDGVWASDETFDLMVVLVAPDGFDDYIVPKNVPVASNIEFVFPHAVVPEQPYIEIRWPDFGVPKLGRKWWDGFLEDLENLSLKKADKPLKMVVFCQGGHGRTGTFLSILYDLLGLFDWLADPMVDMDPVASIRRLYSSKAVESAQQLIYIEQIIDNVIYSDIVRGSVWVPQGQKGPTINGVPVNVTNGSYGSSGTLPTVGGAPIKTLQEDVDAALEEIEERRKEAKLEDGDFERWQREVSQTEESAEEGAPFYWEDAQDDHPLVSEAEIAILPPEDLDLLRKIRAVRYQEDQEDQAVREAQGATNWPQRGSEIESH